MDEKPAWLVEKEIPLDNGNTAQWSYDTEGDMLEIFFQEGNATCTVELADGVFLRLDLQQRRPLSIAFLAVSALTRYGEFGPFLLQLDGLKDLSDELRQTVIQIITSPPVSSVLKVFSYSPSPQRKKPMPVAWLPHQLAS
ncbi:MAG: DUF2283 domain-containing protein [Anaerolineae bacterium]